MDHGTVKRLETRRTDLITQLAATGEELPALHCWSPDAHAPDFAARILTGDINALEPLMLAGFHDPEGRH